MTKTIALTGAEVKITDLGGQNVAIKNLSAGSIYASAYPDIVVGADDVIEISSYCGELLLDAHGTVYLLGSGKAQCTGTNYTTLNFRLVSGVSGGGGSDTEKGAYYGETKFISSAEGVKSIAIEGTSNIPARLAEAFAQETGWELQEDGVTILKDGNVGFKFTNSYIYLTNDLGGNSDLNFAYLPTAISDGVIIDICTTPNGTTAFGCRVDETYQINLPFILAQNANGGEVVLTPYTYNRVYMLRSGEMSYEILPLPNIYATSKSVALYLLPDIFDECLLNDIFFSVIHPNENLSTDSVLNIDGKKFRLLKSSIYSDNPWLTIPL